MSEAVMQAVEQLTQTFADFKQNFKQINEQQVKGIVDPLLKETQDRINNALTKAEDAIEAAEKAQALAKRHAQYENQKSHMSAESLKVKEVMFDYLCKGEEYLSSEQRQLFLQRKAMNATSKPDGGFTVFPEFDQQITAALNETSPMRRYASVKSNSSGIYQKLQRKGRPGASWVGEQQARTQTSGIEFDVLEIQAKEIYAMPSVTEILLSDSSINIEQELINSVVEEFEISENTAFVSGDGIKQPRGILTYTAGTSWGQIEQVNSGNANDITYAGLIDLVYSLKDSYLNRAAFMMRRSTIAKVRKIQDGQGNPIWSPGFGSEPATLLGYPIARAADMPEVAANALPIAFGDFGRAYIIIDKQGATVLRDPYSAKPYILFYTRKRVGGGVDNFEAIKLQKISA